MSDDTTPMTPPGEAGDAAAASAPSSVPAPPPPTTPAPTASPRRGRRALAALAAVLLVLASATGGALVALAIEDDDAGAPVRSSLDEAPAPGDGTSADEPRSAAAAAVLPSVVSIDIDAGGPTGSGSGIVISEDGLILTNNHVAAPAAAGGSLSVTFADGSRADAEIVGRDPATDLAVLRAQDVSGLTPARLGSSADLNVGDPVLAVGSPLGLDGSVTSGIVSALGRAINLPGGGGRGAGAVIDAIQTDAAINPGNSGGALANVDGEVVGVNTAIASLAQGATSQGGNIGVGFAIPIDAARDIARQLIDEGTVTHAYLGVRIGNAPAGGAVVAAVEPGQPADEAGLAEGDVITRFDGEDVSGVAGLTAAIRTRSPGDEVSITFERDGEEQTVEVTLGELPG